ncbi:MAG: riboflavin synthase [Candidatus Omnitrophica bacterium]|nr:riboflavin synthase [Candidatus Omnitrophota bacterium]
MFSGIVEELGIIKNLRKKQDFIGLEVEADKVLEEVSAGDSIALNGACLTIVKLNKTSLLFDIMKETLNKTNLQFLKVQDRVNLERPLRLSNFISGHLLSGHIDGLGYISKRIISQNETKLDIKIPKILYGYIVPKGSVAVDGVSLTIADIREDTFSVYLIPFTKTKTTLGIKKIKDPVNIEVDLIGKYIRNMLTKIDNQKILTEEFLRERGFL